MCRFAHIVSDSIFTNSYFSHASVNAGDIQRDALEGNQARALLGVGTFHLPNIRYATELHKRTSSSPNYQICSGRCVSVLLLHSNPSEAMLSLRRIGILDRFAHIVSDSIFTNLHFLSARLTRAISSVKRLREIKPEHCLALGHPIC